MMSASFEIESSMDKVRTLFPQTSMPISIESNKHVIKIENLNIDNLSLDDLLSINIGFNPMINSPITFDVDEIFTNKFHKLNTNEDIIQVDHTICPICNIPGKINESHVLCESCGMERVFDSHQVDTYSTTVDQNYNTMDKSFMTFSIVGVNSYCYNRSLLKTCADYSAYRNNSNKKDIVNRIYQYEGNKPPMNIINGTADLFDQIKNKGYVFRGDGKLGVIAACLYYVSIEHNLTRTPKEISSIMGVEEKFISQGDKTLQELNELGIISIKTNHTPLNDYLNVYFPALNINDKYRGFIIDIISRAERKRLHVGNESRLTTKVVGAIYLLTQRVPELKSIKKDVISNECNKISKTTFIKYYTLICNNFKIMKKCFRKHHIPMPNNWRNV
ncbi:MAG: hypothetical protein ACRCZI_13090 [Cetobacterium sp.]